MSTQLSEIVSRPASLGDQVFARIRDGIVDKTLPPGAVVSEAGLAKSLSVSKTPVREALLRLRELGLVESAGARGLKVVAPSSEAIVAAYEARWSLERATADLAARRASETTRTSLSQLAEHSLESAEGCDTAGFTHWDHAFHNGIADAANSPDLARLARDSIIRTSALRGRDAPVTHASTKCAREHKEIAQAIASGDSALASELAGNHIMHVMSNVLASYLGSS